MFIKTSTQLLGSFLLLFFAFFNNSMSLNEGTIKSTNKGFLFEDKLRTAVLDSFIEANRLEHKIPAVSLALIKNGEIIYHKNYGVVNSITNEPVTKKSLFEAASITKPIFAYTVCRLAQKGIIDLDAPLHERFPFPELEKFACYKEMTARHILTHTSGLPNWGTDMIGCPGDNYGYSGQGFEYLTKALAQSFTKKMNRTIMRHLKNEVLEPSGMSNTYFIKSQKLKKHCVDGHLKNEPTNQIFPTAPEMAFGMHCSAKDIAKFAIMLNNRVGLTDEMAKDMLTIHTKVPDAEKEFKSNYDQGYGLGIYIRGSQYGEVFGHSGSNYDFKCLFEIYDDLNMGYVIMTNSDTGDNLINKMAPYLMGE